MDENEEDLEDFRKRNLQAMPIMQPELKRIFTTKAWVPRGVDRGFIMSYKAICDNCSGNGHINIVDNKGKIQVKQCWMCNSQGEIKYEEDFINKLIHNHNHRLH